MIRTILISLILFAPLGLSAETQIPRAMTPVDFVEAPRLSDPRLSPDGRYLLYKQSETNWDENVITERFQLIDLQTDTPLPVPVAAEPDESVSDVYWKPDSTGFVFLQKPEDEKKQQAYFYEVTTQSASRLTDHGESVLDLFWAPHGNGFYFTSAEQQPSEDTNMLSGGWLIPPFEANADREIWYFDLALKSAEPIVFGTFSVRDVTVSRNGAHLSYLAVPNHELDTRFLGDVFVRDLATGANVRRTSNLYQESEHQLSPDGQQLAFIATVNQRGEPYYEDKVFIQSLGDAPQRLLADMPIEALDFAWDKTGEGLFILGNTGLSADLYHLSLKTRELRQLTAGQHSLSDWTYYPEADTHIARIATAENPGEVFLMQDEAIGFKQVTNTYQDWSQQFLLPAQEAVTWRGRRGVTIEGLLVYPIGYEAGKRYPLVTVTHGGPRSSSRFGSWNVSRYLPVLAGQGYMVFLPNHRGGTGYGDAFVRDMYGSYFRNAHHDVMDGIDALIARGLVDPDRLIKMGWSAGGHMVNKLITHTDRFKVASSGAGASDWLSMHGESDVRHGRPHVFGGAPWDRDAPRRQYTKHSPLKDAWKVTTPTLFFTGEKDVRVPPTQSILMYRGVRATGTPTRLFIAEDEPHNFRKPANQLFKINTELAWYARFALGKDYKPFLPDEAFEAAKEANSEADLATSP